MKSLLKLLMVVCLLGTAYGQTVNAGRFGASDDHQYDSIDLATLVPTFQFPAISKPGAIPLSVSISSPQVCGIDSFAARWACNGSPSNFHNGYGSFNTSVPAALWNTTASFYVTGGSCLADHVTGLIAPNGAGYHPISAVTIYYPSGCGSGTANVTTTDGSYISATLTAGGSSVTVSNVVLPNGWHSTINSVVDAFGNSVTFTAPTFTDTLGSTGVTLPAHAVSYVDTNGGTQQVSLTIGTATQWEPYHDGECSVSNGGTQSFSPVSSVNYPDGTSVGIGWDINTGKPSHPLSGLIGSITLPTGGTVSYTYTPATINCTAPEWSYSAITRTTPDGTTSYSTSNNVTTVLDPGKNKSVYTFVLANPGCSGVYCLGVPVLTQVQRYQNTGTVSSPVYSLLTTDVYCYNNNQTNCATATVAYPITQRDAYHTIAGMSTSSRVSETYDTYGNRTSVAAYDFGASSFTAKTTVTYGSWNGSSCVYVGSNIRNLPCDALTSDGTHNLSESRHTYNAQGFETGTSVWTGSSWLSSSAVPNPNGAVASSTSANGQITYYGYSWAGANGQQSCNGLLPASAYTIVNGVTLSSAQSWDCNTGLVLTTTNANGNTPPATQYDSMLRSTLVTDNLGFSVSTSYTSNSVTSTPSFGTPSIGYVDNIARPILGQHQQSSGSSNYDTASSSYAFSGPNHQVTSSSPCTKTAGNPCTTNFTTSLGDGFGRPISTTDPLGGTETYAYNQNDASITVAPAPTGEHVKTAQTEVDGLGRPKSVCALQTSGGTACGQAMGNSGIVTTYAYSFGTGQSTVSVVRGGQTHTTQTDALGRVVYEWRPESGTTNAYFDSTITACVNVGFPASQYGDMVAKTDANGNAVCYAYDGLHRLVTVSNSFGANTATNPCLFYRYDSTSNEMASPPVGYPTVGANIAGRIFEATTTVSCTSGYSIVTDEWFAYDADGRMTDMWESTPHSGGYYHTWVTYNPNGAVASVNGIPGYSALTFGVDGEGRPSTASLGAVVLINGATYDAASNPLSALVGTSGDSDTFTYDAAERMKTWNFTVNGKTHGGTLTWSPNATLDKLVIADTFNAGGAQTCTFAYDDVARLTDDNCGSTLWHQTFGYDQYDNLTKTGNPGTSWNPGYDIYNHMVGSSYDAAGHLTYDGVNTYSWDVYGKMIGTRAGVNPAVCGTNGDCATYDAFGRIVEATTNGNYQEFLFSPIGRLAQMSGATTVTETRFSLPGGLAVKTTGAGGGGSKTVFHNDWLGTARLGTSLGSRTMTFDTAYTPYGESYDTFGTLKQNFTGDLQDIAAGLFDTPNRELATNASRWLSPDPAGASWNAYAYSTNPNSETDPSGLTDEPQDSPQGDGDPFHSNLPSCVSTNLQGPCKDGQDALGGITPAGPPNAEGRNDEPTFGGGFLNAAMSAGGRDDAGRMVGSVVNQGILSSLNRTSWSKWWAETGCQAGKMCIAMATPGGGEGESGDLFSGFYGAVERAYGRAALDKSVAEFALDHPEGTWSSFGGDCKAATCLYNMQFNRLTDYGNKGPMAGAYTFGPLHPGTVNPAPEFYNFNNALYGDHTVTFIPGMGRNGAGMIVDWTANQFSLFSGGGAVPYPLIFPFTP